MKDTVDRIGHLRSLDPLADTLQNIVRDTFRAAGPAGQTLKNFLHGIWLGHPLHPVLTDVPVGAWTVAAVLDLAEASSGDERLGAGADAAVALGLGGAVGSAVSGLTDWHILDSKWKRIGLVHGLLNITAVILYSLSLIFRGRRERAAGRTTAFLGYLIAAVSAYLGGELVYELQVGVDHTAELSLPKDFVPVLADNELREGELRRVEAKGVPVLLVRRGSDIYALVETCSHQGGPLSEGKLVDNSVVCPWHSSRFALEDGRVLDGPSTFWQPCFETRVQDGQIEVRKRQMPS